MCDVTYSTMAAYTLRHHVIVIIDLKMQLHNVTWIENPDGGGVLVQMGHQAPCWL